MNLIKTAAGVTVSYDSYGVRGGQPLILVHGGFSDHETNWMFVKEELEKRYRVYAVARRGRGKTDATDGHSMEDEFSDLAALISSIDEPVFLLGHSYGAHVSLGAAHIEPEMIRKLVLYEPPNPREFDPAVLRILERLAAEDEWDDFAETFFRDMLHVPAGVIGEMKAPEIWSPIISDSRASLGDIRAVARYAFDANRFRNLQMPVLLQVGSESPRELYVTDPLAAVLPDARIEELPGQAHEAMTTAPALYAESVSRFLI